MGCPWRSLNPDDDSAPLGQNLDPSRPVGRGLGPSGACRPDARRGEPAPSPLPGPLPAGRQRHPALAPGRRRRRPAGLRRGPLPRVRPPRRPGPPPSPHAPPRSRVESAHGPGRLRAARTPRPRRRPRRSRGHPPGRGDRREAARPPLPPPLSGLPRKPDGPPPHARLALPRLRRGRSRREAGHREPPGAVPSAPRTPGG